MVTKAQLVDWYVAAVVLPAYREEMEKPGNADFLAEVRRAYKSTSGRCKVNVADPRPTTQKNKGGE